MADGSLPPHPNATSQVDRIREVLVGRQLTQVEQRLQRLEDELTAERSDFSTAIPEEIHERLRGLQRHFLQEISILKDQMAQEVEQWRRRLDELAVALETRNRVSPHALLHTVSRQMEELRAGIAARTDARIHEVLAHLQSELQPWQQALAEEFHRLAQSKADREELQMRFARLASAAVDEPRFSRESEPTE